MDPVYLEIRRIARQIAARQPQPDFYIDHPEEVKASQHFYRSDATIVRLRRKMVQCLEDDFGHGMGHVEKVALDAGVLTIVESRLKGLGEEQARRNLLLAQCAGLLHDICRKEKFHAEKGAQKAGEILKRYPLSDDEVHLVCMAIRNHEAFTPLNASRPRPSGMISDCLYDADKFRWGPDNFNHTLWDMVDYLNPPLSRFMDHYPKGMAMLKKIRATFRSQTGRRYGPQFIDMGIAIGEELYRIILSDFVDPT
ncbi:hypothetical protein DSCW_53940 [Desulfosarcina widdelii]|uniref:HD domain-containing protein n=1 Tax=Desulfosarcina widdelii TaxID=947919 RepID=A0A5K7ZNW8_9BACT|nr:HD domain-containing protein [Desulfosarcina widdelii]BBO77977.1 hypothetical protein DSCW_53940 [Desulfosarcina widdelii]